MNPAILVTGQAINVMSLKTLGITVLGDFILSEGVETILANLHRVGATAVACNPTVTAPANEHTGSFQPPDDAGSSPRLFDRTLFGKRSLWVRSGPSFRPRKEFYSGIKYQPRTPNDLTDQHGALIGQFIHAATESGLKVYLQVGATRPSGLQDEDRPRLPDGTLLPNRMADTGSLASRAIRDYNAAYVRDLLAAYPSINGFRIDWPESPCYTFEEIFQDFSPHVEEWATAQGFRFSSIRADVGRFHEYLSGSLTNDDLSELAEVNRGPFAILQLLTRFPGCFDWLRLKAALSADLVRHWREILDDAGGSHVELTAHAFMPPWSLLTGLDFARVATHVDCVSPKLYTMHWPLMVTFWGRHLLKNNRGLDEGLLTRALVSLMDLADSTDHIKSIDQYHYPQPDEPHPIADAPQLRKIGQVRSALGRTATTRLIALVHGYGPTDDFVRRFKLIADSDVDGIWINRYGYLSDAKLDALAGL
ncbi:MAG: hypothetical protein ABGZ35_25525 [Planctomycetaceae bacterium]